MLSEIEFTKQTKDAYEHLYDLVYLRTHSLTDVLVPDLSLRPKEKAWQLHHILSNVIGELDPGPRAPVFSREWRRYRLMVLHYLEGLDPQAVADELGISRRHYYREHEAALKAIAGVLWNRYRTRSAEPQQASQVSGGEESPSHLELLRLEAARVAQADRYARVADVIPSICALLQEMLHQHELDCQLMLPETLPRVSIDQVLLRQLLLAVMGYLIEWTNHATIQLLAQAEGSMVRLSLTVDPPTAIQQAFQIEAEDRLSALTDMATLCDAHILPIRDEQSIAGFEVRLPTRPQRTVLVVDDNEDVLELFHRYLVLHNYRVITALVAQDALDLARRLQPYAITLDLMMPDQDGWDVLQILLNQPDTQHIPIIVCSVLRQRDLALSLGAAAFLAKPVSEQALLSTLEALEGGETPVGV